MSRYTYPPLDSNRQDIRLLRIDLGNQHSYKLVPIVPLKAAKFVALSYPWGNHEELTTVKVDGIACSVTSTLAAALGDVVKLWTRTHPNRRELFLWTDQLCIDQQNVGEKNYQVGLMTDIYAAASQTIVWLPTISGVAGGFTEWQQWKDWHRGRILDTNWQHLPLPPKIPVYSGLTSFAFPCFTEQDRKTKDLLMAWSHIHGIIGSQWWERGWVYQEFMGPDRVTFLFNGLWATWEKLNEILSLYHKHKEDHTQFCTDQLNILKGEHSSTSPSASQRSRWLNRTTSQAKDPVVASQQRECLRYHGQQIMDVAPSWTRVMYMLKSKTESDQYIQTLSPRTFKIPLSILLKHSRNCQTSHPKDRVYGFLALTQQNHTVHIDYSPAHSLNCVLTSAARSIIQRENRLDILAIARENFPLQDFDQNGSRPKVDGNRLPSWVPDWSTPDSPNLPYRQFLQEIQLPTTLNTYRGKPPCRASQKLPPIVTFLPDPSNNELAHRVLEVTAILVDEFTQVILDIDHKLFRSFRCRKSNREVDTVKDARVGDEAWVLLGADEVYTLRRIGRAVGSGSGAVGGDAAVGMYTILGHAMIRDADGRTSDVLYGSMIDKWRSGQAQVQRIQLC